jgi:hypothetical protein
VANTVFDVGTLGGTDTLWARLLQNNGQLTAWQQFTVTAPADTGPVVNSVSNIKTVPGQSFAASNLFTASDPFNDAIAQYDFWDTGSGGGHFLLNNQVLGANQDNFVSAAQLGQTTYVSGSGVDTLWVRVNEGGQWSPWSPSFTISDPTTIGTGATLELASAYSGTVSFAAATGTLKIDNSASFGGTIAGQLASGDVIDLADVTAGANATIAYSGNKSPGTLTVSDGTHTANIALLGNYSLSSFVASSDGHGGTSIVDPPLMASSLPAGAPEAWGSFGIDPAPADSFDAVGTSFQARIAQRLTLLTNYMASTFTHSAYAESGNSGTDPSTPFGPPTLLTNPAQNHSQQA